MHAVIGATEEHKLTKIAEVFLCITLILNETVLVVDIIKPVAVSRLLKNKETKLYGLCI